MARPIFLFIILFALTLGLASASSVVVYKNEACGHCVDYLSNLTSMFSGSDIKIYDFINEPAKRKELATLQERFSVPIILQGHLVVLVDDRYLFEGHFPLDKMKEFLTTDAKNYQTVVASQDSMGSAASFYLATADAIKKCDIDQSIPSCEKTGETIQKREAIELPKVDFTSYLLPALIVLLPAALIIKYGILEEKK